MLDMPRLRLVFLLQSSIGTASLYADAVEQHCGTR
jgi:hypothetical protein